MKRDSNYISYIFVLVFLLMLIGCSDPPNTDDQKNEEENYLEEIEGTWQDTESSRSFTINNLHVLFQYPNPVPPSDTVTYGNFAFISYDGTCVNIYDFDKKVVSFNAIKDNGVLTLSGLGTIKIFDEPYDPRDYRSWNSTYEIN